MKTDILIIGAGPAGMVAAMTARKFHPDKSITVVRKNKTAIVPCGIPYIFKRMDSVDQDVIPSSCAGHFNINLIIDEATKIDFKNKKAHLKNKEPINYEKLIIATGSTPRKPPIKGIEKQNVFAIKKDYNYLKKLRDEVIKSKEIAIIGGGFAGVEIAEELSNFKDKNITIIERMEHCLIHSFDKEFCIKAEKKLREKGIKIHTNAKIKEIKGKERAECIELEGNIKIKTDLIILVTGDKPNTDFLKNTEIELGNYGGIKVNRYMETNIKDVFAIGDCVESEDFFTGKHIPIMLASKASNDARKAASNLYSKKIIEEKGGVFPSYSTYLGDTVISGTGLTEKRAKEEGIDIVIGTGESESKHPGTLKGTKKIKVKLIFSKEQKILLGAQVYGPENVSELINILSFSIQQEHTAFDLLKLNIATHPLITCAPTSHPIVLAVMSVL